MEASIKSQNASILEHMENGNSITPLEALNKFGCFRLSARIYDLKRLGKKIESVMVESNGKKYSSYFLV